MPEAKGIQLSNGMIVGFPRGERGEKGEKGDTGAAGRDGKDGERGEAGAAGYTPQKGVDYWTAADKQEIIDEVANSAPSAIPAYTEADFGKMLTPTADGLVWTDPPQGGEVLEDLEGVLF